MESNEKSAEHVSAVPLERRVRGWQPIKTAPTTGREMIWLKTPYSPDGVLAYSGTWWTCGFSVECKPTHWKWA